MKNYLLACFLLAASLLTVNNASAQPPDCVSGNVAYTVFNDSISSVFSSTLDSMEIRSVNLLTGAVGGLMGNRRYWVRKYDGSGSAANDNNYYYGSSALAVDFATSRFYVMTQMSNPVAKDIITINPVGGAMTIIGTTPSSMDDYHFVKMAAHPTNGYVYAIGVVRDTTLVASNRVNPIIRFQKCGVAPTAGCATGTIQVIGYLASGPLTKQWLLFNGDIAFDSDGDMYFATAAYESVNGSRYTDSRLFRINRTDLPTSSGTTSIPLTLLSEYNSLDSTVINGVAFSGAGNMFMTTRRYNGIQNVTGTTFSTQLYASYLTGTTSLMTGFNRPTPGTSGSDLATCYFPALVLAGNRIDLTGQYVSGVNNLNWNIDLNQDILSFQVQRSNDGVNFQTIDKVDVVNINGTLQQSYSFKDRESASAPVVYYRIAQVRADGMRYFSNIVKLSGAKISFSKKVTPNPFVGQLDVAVHLRLATDVTISLRDQSGRLVYSKKHRANAGENAIKITDVSVMKPGVYFIELATNDEVIREKLIKQ